MTGTPWLDLPYQSLSRENVRIEAGERGLTLRKLMALYYHHDRERAVQLSFSWCVDRKQPEQLFGRAQVGKFVGDLAEFLEVSAVTNLFAKQLLSLRSQATLLLIPWS